MNFTQPFTAPAFERAALWHDKEDSKEKTRPFRRRSSRGKYYEFKMNFSSFNFKRLKASHVRSIAGNLNLRHIQNVTGENESSNYSGI